MNKKGFGVLGALLLIGLSLYGVKGKLESPGPIFAFGQNILPKGDTKADVFFEYIRGDQVTETTFDPALVYGITDRLSFQLSIPIFLYQQFRDITAPGFGNIRFQFEYAFHQFSEDESRFSHESTVVAAFLAPNGNTEIKSFVSNPKPVYFLGVTTSFLGMEWHTYGGIGAIITQMFNDGQKIGNKITYDLGIGRSLFRKEKYYIAGLIEMSGLYSDEDIDPTTTVPNFPNNVIFLGPSFRIEKRHTGSVFQIGFQYPISQPRLPLEEKFDFRISAAFSWRF